MVRAWVLEPGGEVNTYIGTVDEISARVSEDRLTNVITVLRPFRGGDRRTDAFYIRAEPGTAVGAPLDGFKVGTESGILRIQTPSELDVVSYGPAGWLEMHTSLSRFAGPDDGESGS
jgi:hypothetical protein